MAGAGARLDRRDFLRFAGGTATALALGSQVAPAKGASAGLSEWVIAVAEDPSVFSNPLMPGGGVGSIRVQSHVFDSLAFSQGPDLAITPFLATSWQIVEPTRIRFHLRDGIKFHNGDPVTPDDVKYSFEKGLADSKLSYAYYMAAVKEVAVVNPKTVDVLLKSPYAPLIYNFSFGIGGVVSKKARESMGIARFNKQPVGAGPYRVVGEWTSGQPIHIEAFDNYWAGKPTPQRMTVKLIQDASTRTAELLAGRAQLIASVSIADIPLIEKSGKAKVKSLKASEGRGRNIQYTFNPERPFFSDLRVRQALNYAVDRASIVKDILQGHAAVMAGIMPKGWLGYVPSIEPWPYDPSKAKELLKAAGYGGGFEFTWEITDGVFLRDREIAETVATQLQAVGVKVNVRITERAVQFDHYFAGNYDLNTLQWPVMKDPDGNMAWNLEQSKPMAKYQPYDELRALTTQARITYDINQREAIYKQINQKMWALCPWLYIHVQDEIFAADNRIAWDPVPFEGQATEVWYLDPQAFEANLKVKNR
jgi:peptide/nickel transport system substrate-binding protein